VIVASNPAPEKVGKEQDLPDNSPPSISFHKGDGAIRGISEKFAANSITDTAFIAMRNVDSCAGPGLDPRHS
jgi:hypothetical protein